MIEVVSISLGSSKRDHESQAELLGKKVRIRRLGTDGSIPRALDMLRELDGQVAAMGLGGVDLYLFAGERRYILRDAVRLRRAVKSTPIVDGSGLKNTLERLVIRRLCEEGFLAPGKKVLLVSAVDRFGMEEALAEAGCEITYGDLVFALGLPFPIRSRRVFRAVARILLPALTKLPISMLYPTGHAQERGPKPGKERYYEEAEIIAGDYHLIRKYLPERLEGKMVITNTVTPQDVEELRGRGVEYLITTTPEFDGRSFGTNVMEAVLVAVIEKDWSEITQEDYLEAIGWLGLGPHIARLQDGRKPDGTATEAFVAGAP